MPKAQRRVFGAGFTLNALMNAFLFVLVSHSVANLLVGGICLAIAILFFWPQRDDPKITALSNAQKKQPGRNHWLL